MDWMKAHNHKRSVRLSKVVAVDNAGRAVEAEARKRKARQARYLHELTKIHERRRKEATT